MDLARRPYTTACRFLRDSDTVSMIRWTECHPDAQPLPYPSVILSLDMERSDNQEWPVGEVDGAPRRFIRDVTPPGLIGDHVCGTEQDFGEGGEYRPDLPPAEYAQDGWLKCCEPPKTIRGGAAAGGHVVPIRYRALAGPGGAGAGGHARPAYQYNVDPTEGGIQVGGEVPEVFSPPTPTSGGVEVGGSCGDVFEPPNPTPGSTCFSAPDLSLDVSYTYSWPGTPLTNQWFHWQIPDGDYHFTSSGFTGDLTGLIGLAQIGTSCASLIGYLDLDSTCQVIQPRFNGGVYLVIFGIGSAPAQSYTFKLQAGLCPP